ncbi:hypothetical protein PPERSA_01344 [Pseudocohnilembus persalinus]|uniref:Uncharacterized protein n=1 Tax=Pseudocohnilembus persalinus TaxID=266149 RepID=A0A0V0QGM6_PSEPJ|nr:hypothetical protein PPERSA_01344 [Pseudocohnilembus persalinus]|eukprot:KRX01441.1 hypothetical protein PPERSA_01344 [Pseudocohnilembus persalinus]
MEAKNLEGIQYQQYENLQSKQSIKKFLSDDYPYKKIFLCDQWFNGNCIIPQDKCQHAHGIKDLVYNKVDYDPINDFDFKHQYIGKYRQQKQYYNKDIQVSVNILDESKFYYLKFPKLGQEFGRKNYVQLIEYAKKNKKLYSDQWKRQKQIEDSENNINDQDNSNNDDDKNGDKQKQKQNNNQITYWQTLIEKSNKLRKKYFLLKKKLVKEDFNKNYPFDENQQCYRFYIKQLPKQKEVEHLIIEKAVQICKKIKNESGFPIKWKRCLEFNKIVKTQELSGMK